MHCSSYHHTHGAAAPWTLTLLLAACPAEPDATTTAGSTSGPPDTTSSGTTADSTTDDPTAETTVAPTTGAVPDTTGDLDTTTTDASASTGAPGVCGDGIVDANEECDDGNLTDTDTCRLDCTLGLCGDGVVIVGVEECDDGNQSDTDSCLASCKLAACGDGVVLPDVEECDDGNPDADDGCSPTCTFECDALHFTGMSMATAADPAGLHATSITAAAWYRAKADAPYGGIVTKQGDVFGGHVTYAIAVSMNGVRARLQTGIGDGHFIDFDVQSAKPDDTWHHLALTYDEMTGDAALYIDGVEAATDNLGTGLAAADPSLPFAIGASPLNGGFEYPSVADIAEVIIYPYRLDPGEIQGLHAFTYTPNPLAYYPVHEGMGLTSVDASGNGHDLTVPANGWAMDGPLCAP